MLQISHLYADYGGKPALEDINLTLESGEPRAEGRGRIALNQYPVGALLLEHSIHALQQAGRKDVEGTPRAHGVEQMAGAQTKGIQGLLEHFPVLTAGADFHLHPLLQGSDDRGQLDDFGAGAQRNQNFHPNLFPLSRGSQRPLYSTPKTKPREASPRWHR